MRARIATAFLLVLAATVSSGQQPPTVAESPRWVAQQVEHRDTGRDSRMAMTMRMHDRQGRVRERSLVLTALRSTRVPAPQSKSNTASIGRSTSIGDRILIRFIAPNDIKGTGFLVWEHDAEDDERFLYLPALGRVRRIAGAEKQESFVGSDLSYEDIGGREIDDYTYTLVQRDASWTGADGGNHPVWHLESRAVDPQSAFPRSVSVIRKDNFVVVSAEVYNRRNEREKKYDVRRLERIDGIWTAMDVLMVNELQRTRTELIVTDARYNVGLSEADFSRRVLEQRTP